MASSSLNCSNGTVEKESGISVFHEISDACFDGSPNEVLNLWPRACVMFESWASSRTMQQIRHTMEKTIRELDNYKACGLDDRDLLNRMLGKVLYSAGKAATFIIVSPKNTAMHLMMNLDEYQRTVDKKKQITEEMRAQMNMPQLSNTQIDDDYPSRIDQVLSKNMEIIFMWQKKFPITDRIIEYHYALEQLKAAQTIEQQKASLPKLIASIVKCFFQYFSYKTEDIELRAINEIFPYLCSLYDYKHLIMKAENGSKMNAIIEELFEMFMNSDFQNQERLKSLKSQIGELL